MAQYQSDQSQSSQAGAGASKTTVEGCLAGSEGSYSLTDKSGKTYQLTGNTAKMQAHVGHTVQVTGTAMSGANSSSTASQSGSMSGSADAQQTLAVTSFKHVSSSCSSAQ
jgi:hypothetical protein